MGKRNTATRDLQALQLRMAGLSFDQIAERLGYANRGAAWKAYKRAEEARSSHRPQSVEEARDLEVARLDALHSQLWARAQKGNLDAVDRLIKITDRRARLLGLNVSVNAPQQPAAPSAEGDNVVSLTDRLAAMRQGLPGAGT